MKRTIFFAKDESLLSDTFEIFDEINFNLTEKQKLENFVDGAAYRKMVIQAAYAVEARKKELNDLNVFPVPDGDTGTNMSMTINAAAADLRKLEDPSLEKASSSAASAMLRGARGNSGVILSLLFRGISKKLKGAEDYDSEVGAILAIYNLATTGVENFTEEDIPQLVDYAKKSDAIFNTLMSMSEGRPVFYAGVAVAPPTSWRYYDTVYTERFMRTPKENPEGYDCSPISRAKNLSGSLLIIHGSADDNVHYRNVAEYTEALVHADKDFRQLTYTNRNHSIYGGNTRNHLFRQLVKHFKENL